MKFLSILALALTTACGAPSAEGVDEDIGTLEQGLVRPAGYGIDYSNSNHRRCNTLTNCYMPQDKTITYRFFAGTCNSWWQARFVTAVDNWQNLMNDLGWTVVHASTADIEMRCATLPGTTRGRTDARGVVAYPDGHRTFWGSFVWLDAAKISALPSETGKTEVQKQRFAINNIAHELGHAVGLGHPTSHDGADETIMYTFWYDSMPYYSDLENNMLADYVP